MDPAPALQHNFDRLYDRLADRLRSLAMRRGVPQLETEELVHDVFATHLVQRPKVRWIERYLAAAVCSASGDWSSRVETEAASCRSAYAALARLVAKEDADAERDLARLVGAPLRFLHTDVSRTLRTGGAVRFLCAASQGFVAGQPTHALDLSDTAVAIASAIADDAYPFHLTFGLRGLAWKERANALRYLSQHEEALEACDRAEDAFRNQRTNVWEIAVVQYVRATIYRNAERYTDAMSVARECAVVFEAYGDLVRNRSARLIEAATLHRLRQLTKAKEIYLQVLREAQDDGDSGLIGYAAMNLGDCETSLNEWDSAHEHLLIAEDIFRKLGLAAERLRAQWNIARLAAAFGRSREAAASFIDVNRGFVELGLFLDAALVDHDRVAIVDQDTDARIKS